MIFAVAGYMGTGSSAVVNLLEEYSNCTTAGLTKMEHIVFYTPHGLFDLEDRLLLNNTIHNSDAAISEFYSEMQRLNNNDFGWCGGFQKRYGNQFIELVEAFLEELVEFRQKGFWSYDFIEKKRTIKGIIKDSVKLQFKKKDEFGQRIKMKHDNEIKYSFITAERFYVAAKKFVYGYFDMILQGSNKHLILNQVLLPQNLYRLSRYFEDDLRVVVCQRDARDMFILSKYIWPNMGCEVLMPSEVNEFIRFYCGLRKTENRIDDFKIKRIWFEDLVYCYDKTVRDLEEFLGLESQHHEFQKKYFEPEKSIHNTQNFLIQNEWNREVASIGKKLPEMIYEFPYPVYNSLNQTFDK